MIKDNVVFLREFLKEFQTTGTMFPSSPWAAKALTNPLRGKQRPQRIVELGPGTGPVTVKILSDMRDGDTLTLCEINPRFMAVLKENLKDNPDYTRHRERITFFQGPVQDLPETVQYDVIVCAIPFLNLDLSVVKDIFAKLERISTKDAVMTYYEYIGLRTIGKVVAAPERKRRLKELDGFFKSMQSEKQVERERVWLNLLPINIYTLEIQGRNREMRA
jgi:phospholipid N-methyltransferase